jgi:hypothetical protein
VTLVAHQLTPLTPKLRGMIEDPEKSVERRFLARLPEEHRGLQERIIADIDPTPSATR